MIKIYVKKQADYPVSAVKIRQRLREFLRKSGIVSDSIVNIALVGKKRMSDLSRRYLKGKDGIHNVLSFTESEIKGKFVYPNDGMIRLGEIIVCYPKAFEEAKKEGKLIEDKVYELIEHGARHLLGEHH
jgi:rRNA maturation RNase YbeY